MSRVQDTPTTKWKPAFERYSGGAIKWVNAYGAVRYQPYIDSDSGDRFLYEKSYGFEMVDKGWVKEENATKDPWPVLYRSRKRAKRKAWKTVVKWEGRKWKRA